MLACRRGCIPVAYCYLQRTTARTHPYKEYVQCNGLDACVMVFSHPDVLLTAGEKTTFHMQEAGGVRIIRGQMGPTSIDWEDHRLTSKGALYEKSPLDSRGIVVHDGLQPAVGILRDDVNLLQPERFAGCPDQQGREFVGKTHDRHLCPA